MAYRRISPSDWTSYLGGLTKRLGASKADVRVDALDVGDEAEVEQAPLLGIDYDAKDRAIDLAFEHLDHRISDIGDVWVDERDGRLHALCVARTDGRLEVVEFVPVLELTDRQAPATS